MAPSVGEILGARVVHGLVLGVHETRTTGNNFCETSGTLPAASEGAEAVYATNVGHGSEAVCDRGAAVQRQSKVKEWHFEMFAHTVYVPGTHDGYRRHQYQAGPTPRLRRWSRHFLKVKVAPRTGPRLWGS